MVFSSLLDDDRDDHVDGEVIEQHDLRSRSRGKDLRGAVDRIGDQRVTRVGDDFDLNIASVLDDGGYTVGYRRGLVGVSLTAR